VTKKTIISITLAILLTLTAGASLGYEFAPTKEPRACAKTRELTPKIFLIQSNLLSAVNARGDALGKDDYAEHDADVNHYLKQLNKADRAFNALYNECEES
jgi:hypothetical protein